MYKPLIRYLVASPYGDISVDEKKLELILEGDPLKTPYRLYFQTIEDFLQRNRFKHIIEVINKKYKINISLKEIYEILIRAEKHGVLYHPASIEIFHKKGITKFGLNIAFTERGKTTLKNEFKILKKLHIKYKLPYLPEPYIFNEINSIAFLLEEWFENYHEFHMSIDKHGRKRLKLWEFGKGYKFLSGKQEFEIYKEVAKILTLYYDIYEFDQIYPWHHAAGDFIAHVNNKRIELRLTTARDYKPFMEFEHKKVHPFLPLFYFLLNLTIRTRLDKLDGIGKVVWADSFTIEATLSGFFKALKLKKDKKTDWELTNKFLNLLKSFKKEDLYSTCNPILRLYRGTEDLKIIKSNLDEHIEKLYIILQNLPS